MRAGAYFDVDETLTLGITIFDFMLFDAAVDGRIKLASDFLRDLRQMKESGKSRETVNRHYFTWWAGRDAGELHSRVRQWFDRREATAYRQVVCKRLRALKTEGYRVVLVSAGLDEIVRHVAMELGADDVICTQLECEEGVYTGRVKRPMVGAAKQVAVKLHLRAYALNGTESYAFGDHLSDLEMLEAVGNPVAVATGVNDTCVVVA